MEELANLLSLNFTNGAKIIVKKLKKACNQIDLLTSNQPL
jgi:hypothetical protein